ncbi:ArdC family protein [Paenibacillus alvei]|uniref:ArdC family protein n=1 Tax=Paenibacillus alvei TaxID=44250 RepID=UPI0022821F3F|nr:zincin-like metallopeptidase domain-containing protein [Paenibacillus alvei]
MSNKIYEMVTDRIIALLEKGIVPWRRPWVSGAAVNWKTQKPYRGVNTILLDPGEYATFKQISEAGGKVKKGQKGHIVVFWTWLEVKDEETEEMEKVPFLRYYNVFEINTQCEGLKSKRNEQTFDHDPISEAERISNGYVDAPKLQFAPGRAYYRPSSDVVSVPPLRDYPKAEEYYSTLFHEYVHSTGHSKRLNRSGITELAAFGDESYSKEELVAEIGAAMLCGTAGIDNSTIDNSASYIGGWLRKLKDEKKWLVQAAAQAQKAADYILDIKFSEEAE